jgi:uncharacterized protein YceH (UPF0502 family)
MPLVWDLLQQFQLRNTKSRSRAAMATAKQAAFRSKLADTRSRSAEAHTRDLEVRVDELEREIIEVRTTFAILLDRLERRFGPEVAALLEASGPPSRVAG